MADVADTHLRNGGLLQGLKSSDKFKKVTSLADDITVLKSIWFSKAKSVDHASRLEEFYAPQAHACTPLPGRVLAALQGDLLRMQGVVFVVIPAYFIFPFIGHS